MCWSAVRGLVRITELPRCTPVAGFPDRKDTASLCPNPYSCGNAAAKQDGTEARHLQLAHNTLDAAERRSKVYVMSSTTFGWEATNRQALERLVASVSSFLDRRKRWLG
jgi:hypothetical protein